MPEAITKLGPFAVFGAAAWAVGCLPAGAPPAGQHIVHDRTLAGVYFVPSEVAGVPSRVLALGPLRPYPRAEGDSRRDMLADVYYVPLAEPPSTAAALDQGPIITDFVLPNGAADTYRIVSDSWGRPVYLRCLRSSYDVAERFDWATGKAEALGLQYCGDEGFWLSPGRTRVATGGVTELDGSYHSSFNPRQDAFVGEDLYFVAEAHRTVLARNQAGGPSELLLASTDELGMAAIGGDRTPQILVCLSEGVGIRCSPPCGSGYTPFGLLDTETLTMSPLPFHAAGLRYFSASDSGHWLLFTGPTSPDIANRDVVLHDWTTGETARVDGTTFPNLTLIGTAATAEWRPGRDEVWFRFFRSEGFATWKPESGFVPISRGSPVAVRHWPDRRDSAFTRDGAHYFSMRAGQALPICVGPADDPTAPVFPIQPAGTWLGALWETEEGGLLVGASTVDSDRQELSIVDPVTGASRAIASGGHVIELGHGRALAIVSWESTRRVGDLVLIDLATGQQTLLAENAYAAAVDPGVSADVAPGADRLRSGTRVAFLTRSRFESPYDGLWMATLP